MTKAIILGAGHIGTAIAVDLASTGAYEVTLADRDASRLTLRQTDKVVFKPVDVTDPAALRAALRGQDVVISACPFYLNVTIAEAALEVGVHYFDLTEDVATTKRVA